MESILARALEYTLKYWLRSFSRDQFKLQGRTVQLSNLDINGDVLHASLGLPPALHVATAKVGKLEIQLPYVSNVQVEPITVQIDRLDVVLEEKSDMDAGSNLNSNQSSTSSGKGSGYGFADKIADGMTLEVGTVNLLLETRGGAQREGGATWAAPLASITIRDLLLYTTNENWEVVNLKEARDFSNNKKSIYVFKKLQWASLSVDLLPHPDMFADAHITSFESREKKRDNDGAKRVFFVGERFLEGISGEAYITVQRTELNSPLGLEVQLHITEAVCPALSEPGLRAFLRFMTGLYVCLNRGDVDPNIQQCSTEAAGRSLVSIIVDHIFLCIKDAEFQLDLLMQSLFFSRASVSDGKTTKNLTRVMVAGFFLRDTFARPPCTLIQPSMEAFTGECPNIPDFGKNFCPPIYPLGDERWKLNNGISLISLHALQVKPSPPPPTLASQTVIDCQPLMISLQEESFFRISSFLADGIVVNRSAVLPDYSINSLVFSLKVLDLIVPLGDVKSKYCAGNGHESHFQPVFTGARLHIEKLAFVESPAIKFQLLNLDKDPACFCFWHGQPIDASQKKWTVHASNISIFLETSRSSLGLKSLPGSPEELWRCIELHNACFEVAIATSDGCPLITLPPPGGVVRIGVACQLFLSNTSVEQFFFVLDLYAYFGRVTEEMAKAGKRSKLASKELNSRNFLENAPSDTAVSLAVNDLHLKFLESSTLHLQGTPLVQFGGEDLFVKISHRTLGGAIVVSSNLHWQSVRVDCVDAANVLVGLENSSDMPNGFSQMRAVFWIHDRNNDPFLDVSTVHVIPYHAQDECHSLSVAAKVAGVRLGGGMNYTEALLHRFGILGSDGGPGEGLSKGLKNLSEGPLSKLMKASPLQVGRQEEIGNNVEGEEGGDGLLELGKPDDLEISIELKDWLFALEGAKDMEGEWQCRKGENVTREERSWHTAFQSLQVKAKNAPKNVLNKNLKPSKIQKYPVELVTVSVEGLQALKPHALSEILPTDTTSKGRMNGAVRNCGGIDLEVQMFQSEDDETVDMSKWVIDKLKFSVKQPIEAVATKEELNHLTTICKSEVDSMGRLAAGILRVLKLDSTIGEATLEQLSNLGSEGIDRIFSPRGHSRRSSGSSQGYSPVMHFISESPRDEDLEATVALIEDSISDSQAKCSALVSKLDDSETAACLSDVEELKQKLERLQNLFTKLKTHI